LSGLILSEWGGAVPLMAALGAEAFSVVSGETRFDGVLLEELGPAN